MRRIKSSIVAWSLAGSLTSFAALYFTLPYDRFLDLALAMAFGVTFAATVKYGRDAMAAFRSGKTGGEFLIVAVFAIVCVLLGQRTWGIILRVLNRPDWLVNSPITIAVPWMLFWAISLALVAPDIDREPEEARSGIWKSAALFIGGALAGFVIAASYGVKDRLEVSEISAWPHLASRPSCPAGSVWGSSTKVYHVENSPYRGVVVPRYCFPSVEEAESSGFRPPKGIDHK